MYDVITIGSATLDVFLDCDSIDTIEHEGEQLIALPYGAKMNVDNALFETGGGGTNTATTFARQGLKTAVIAQIADDFPGEKVLSKLKLENIDTGYIVKDDKDATDFSTIIWSQGKGSVILVNRGKSKLEQDDIDWSTLETKWFYISSVEGNLDILSQVERICSASDGATKIAWNPGKRELKKPSEVLKLLPNTELLVVNRKEAELLLDNTYDQINDMLEDASNLPSKKILITDGHNGAYYHNGHAWYHSNIFQVNRVEATGAGDSFGSAFVSGLIQGKNEQECLKMASANAASVVTSPGAKYGILTKEQMDEWMGKELTIEKL